MSLLYVFAASAIEGEPVRRMASATDSNSILRCGVNDVVLITTGMGPRNAKDHVAAALNGSPSALLARRPDAVLVIGLCGGLTDSLSEGRVVAYTGCGFTDGVRPILSCSDTIMDSVTACLSASGIACDRVTGITSPRIATTPAEKLALAKQGADVVDMESYVILEAAANAGVPAAVLRVVADSRARVLPDLNRALNEHGGLDGRKALLVALGSPLRTARLIAANRRAMRALTKALEIVVKAPCFA